MLVFCVDGCLLCLLLSADCCSLFVVCGLLYAVWYVICVASFVVGCWSLVERC